MLPSVDLIARYDRPGPRYTSYPTALEFSSAITPDHYAASLRACGDGPLSVYVHLPFCEARCLYCACHAIINPDHRASHPYLDRLIDEVERVADLIPHRRPISSLHLGGGTPTFFSPPQLDRLMRAFDARFGFTLDAERAIELDPRVTTPDHLAWMRDHRFNRASIGIQDLDPAVQLAVQREQPLSLITHLTDALRHDVGVPSINADLIYGLPHQTPQTFQRTLFDVCSSIRPERIALYGFAYVPTLKPHQRKLDASMLPQASARLELLLSATQTLRHLGYRDIGMDHFALPSDPLCEAQDQGTLTRNFMGYTTARSPDILGFGLSAIGYMNGAFFQNHAHLKTYTDALELPPGSPLPIARGLQMFPDDHRRAWVIQALMCHFVVYKAAFHDRFGAPFDAYFSDLRVALADLKADGLITQSDDALRVTPLGRWLIRNVALAFDSYTSQRRGASSSSSTAPNPAGGPRHDSTCSRTI